MKVLPVNGSLHEKGCTYTALAEIAKTLNSEGIDAEIFTLAQSLSPVAADAALVESKSA